ncbi:unnamed protein product [Ixodes persulcatus]
MSRTVMSNLPHTIMLARFSLDKKTGVSCKRKQFPVVQPSAVTVQKSQNAMYFEVVYEYE